MKTPLLYLLAAFTLLCSSCEDSDSGPANTPRRDIALSTKSADINRTTQRFSLRLLQEIAKEKETNFCISPLSASLCMGMVLNGADGETYTELQKTLGYEAYSPQEINEYVKSMQTELPSLDKKTLYTSANSLWLRDGFPVQPDFVRVNKEYYEAEVRTEPFTPAIVEQINLWCSEHTAGRIPKILDELPDNAVCFLLNALYFKGVWKSEFKKEDTQNENFYTADGQTLSVPTMQQTATLQFRADQEVRIVELPYGNEAFSMLLFLPTDPENTSITDIFNNLTDEKWAQWMEQMYPQTLHLYLPRFKMEYEKELTNVFQEMGSRKVFDPSEANLSKLSSKQTFIGLLKQKTFIEVDEKGTEAAAVTIAGDFTTQAGGHIPYEVRFDHPFGFVIKEKSTNTLLFAGKVGKPI